MALRHMRLCFRPARLFAARLIDPFICLLRSDMDTAMPASLSIETTLAFAASSLSAPGLRCRSGPRPPGNLEIEAQLKRDRQQLRNEIKMLLLGAGESGKSTVLKQMRLIHNKPYDDEERDSYREIIYSNTVQSMR